MKKHDNWHAHKYEKARDLKAEYREGELHGAVGKEIFDAVKQDKQLSGQSGSLLAGDDAELRKYDDWHAHKGEKNRDLKAEYRETELHGVVGKEIHDLLSKEKKEGFSGKDKEITTEKKER